MGRIHGRKLTSEEAERLDAYIRANPRKLDRDTAAAFGIGTDTVGKHRRKLFAELLDAFDCPVCGARDLEISIYNSRQKPFGQVSLEESTVASLELSAFVRARDRLNPVGGMRADQGSGGHRRKFGGRHRR